jgi:hypothetical protein
MHDKDFSTLKADMETGKMNFQLMQRRMNDIPMRVSERKANRDITYNCCSGGLCGGLESEEG